MTCVLLGASPSEEALNKTYPTSPVTTIRMDVYIDVFKTIYESTFTVPYLLGRTTYYVNDDWTIKNQIINKILDQDVEQYLVIPSTWSTDWKGWCSALSPITGLYYAVPCSH